MSTRALEPPSQRPLQSLRDLFSTFRNSTRSAHPHIPHSLRRRALDAIAAGHRASHVAIACGVSTQSIRSWRKHPVPAARRLAVVKAPSPREEALGIGRRCLAASTAPEAFEIRIKDCMAVNASPTQMLWLIRQLGGLA